MYNLAGRNVNAYGTCTGTPFDLSDLAALEPVASGSVDLGEIHFVRIVDVPGSGDFSDTATLLGYEQDHPIFDPYPTTGSAGFDLEAVGVVVGYRADSDDDNDDDSWGSESDSNDSDSSGGGPCG